MAQPRREHIRIDLQTLMDAIDSGEYTGFCLRCGEQAEEVEPDARGYMCPSCNSPDVYGAEEILIMGQHTEE